MVLALAGLAARAAESTPTVMIVIDGSGSMWGTFEGQKASKYYLVRDAFKQFLPQVRADARTGLASFGHRRRSDCSDVEIIVPPDVGSPTRLVEPIEKLNPKGKGPLALALRDAAAAAGGPNKPATLIVIADGPDNCSQDVCATAADLKKANPQLVVHLLAAGAPPQELPKLSCAAALTGGKLFDVRDAATLTTAVAEALTLANLDVGGPAVRPPTAKGPAQPGAEDNEGPSRIRLSAALTADAGPLAIPLDWKIYKADGAGRALIEKSAVDLAAPLPAGTYLVEARLGLVAKRQELTVKDKGATVAKVDLDAGLVRLKASTHKGAEPLQNPLYTISSPAPAGSPKGARGTALWISRDAAPDVALQPGTYVVRAEQGLSAIEETVELAEGKTVLLDLVLGAGRLELSAVDKDGGQPLDGVTFVIDEHDPDAPQGRREVARSAAPAPYFTLPAGTYQVTARLGASEVRQRIAISGGEVVQRILVMGLARVSVAATSSGQPVPPRAPVVMRVTTTGPEPREVARATTASAAFQLPAGRYRFETQVGTVNAHASVEVELDAGAVVTLPLKVDMGQVALRDSTLQGLARSDRYWEIYDGTGRVVWRTSQTEPRNVLLAPGGYVARSQSRDGRKEKGFAVKAGDQLVIEVGTVR